MKIMKRHTILQILLVMLLLTGIIAPAVAGSAEAPDFYRTGLEVTGVLNEMVQSREFLDLFMNMNDRMEVIDTEFNTGDYDRPVAVYRLTQTDPREWLKTIMSEEEQAQLAALSPALQEQVYAKVKGAAFLANQINGRRGVEILAVTSALQAVLNNTGLETEEPEYYLFIFEKGVPVLVTCGRNTATGVFVAFEKTATESAETLQALLTPLGLEAVPVEIP